MSEENKLPEAVDAQDTRTRKTVKLRPNGVPASQDKPLADPLNSRNTDTGNLEILDDTQTRKTLKLKPMAPGGTAGPKLNLGGGEDTNTRRTVVLRPAGAPAAPVQNNPSGMPQTVRLDAAEVAAAVEENGKVDLEDQTRAVPRPGAAPGEIKLPGVPAAKPATVPTAAAPAAKVEADDQTRAVPRPAAAPGGIKLPGVPAVKPAMVPPAAAPAAAPAAKVETDDQTRAVPRPEAAAPKVEVEDQTRAVPRPAAVPGGVKLPEAPAAETENAEDDQTVKMKRPPRLAPPPPPAAGDSKATVKMPARPAVPGAAPKPPTAAPAAPKPPTAAPKPPTAAPAAPKPPTAAPAAPAPAPAAEAAPAPEAEAPKKNDGEIELAPSKRKTEASGEEGAGEAKAESRTPGRMILDEEENKPSVFYLILAVATLLFVACTAVLTSVHYLYFEQQLDYTQQVPGLPNAK